MNETIVLRVEGEVAEPLELTFADLEAFPPEHCVNDVSRLTGGRPGDAVTLFGLMQIAGVRPEAAYLGLHSSRDDFHASIPLGPVEERGLLIFRLDGEPLPGTAGGPLRFFVPDHAACHTAEIDECANVKYVDRLEFTREKGFDNRPEDEADHAALHEREREDG